MKQRLKLGKISGIPLYVHWTFSLIILFFVYRSLACGMDTWGVVWVVGLVLTIFGCVVLHELGHALSARRYGIGTEDITLLPIGGVARLKAMPRQPLREIVVAIMGPMVNVAIAAGLFVYFWLTSNAIFQEGMVVDECMVVNDTNFLSWLFITNVGLVIFNCIPAFPMDGGRVFRGLLGLRFSRVRATQIASILGRICAIGFAAYSFSGGGPMLILIAIFIYFTATQEYQSVKTEEALREKTVRDAMRTQFTLIPTDTNLDNVVPYITSNAEQGFLVVESTEYGTDLKGGITRPVIVSAVKRHKGQESFFQKYLSRRPKKKGFFMHELMNDKVRYLTPDMPLPMVYQEMMQMRIPVMPVRENNELVGVLDYYQVREFVKLNS